MRYYAIVLLLLLLLVYYCYLSLLSVVAVLTVLDPDSTSCFSQQTNLSDLFVWRGGYYDS